MHFGDFFQTAPHGRPVNPKPIYLTATTKSDILPGGARNPNYPGAFAARVTGCFVFLGGDEDMDAREAALRTLEERRADASRRKLPPIPADDLSLNIEQTYQTLWRVLYEYDEKTRKVGERLFENVNLLRQTVVSQEANRVLAAYYAYVKEEHPEEGPDDATFREAQGGG